MKRRYEYFKQKDLTHEYNTCGNFTKKLCKQETDWTCAFACIRTMLLSVISEVPSEEFIVSRYKLKPSPYYTEDIKKLGILEEYSKDIIYSIDLNKETIFMYTVEQLLEQRYYVMIENTYNIAHWIVVLGYCVIKDTKNIEEHKVIVYVPLCMMK